MAGAFLLILGLTVFGFLRQRDNQKMRKYQVEKIDRSLSPFMGTIHFIIMFCHYFELIFLQFDKMTNISHYRLFLSFYTMFYLLLLFFVDFCRDDRFFFTQNCMKIGVPIT